MLLLGEKDEKEEKEEEWKAEGERGGAKSGEEHVFYVEK